VAGADVLRPHPADLPDDVPFEALLAVAPRVHSGRLLLLHDSGSGLGEGLAACGFCRCSLTVRDQTGELACGDRLDGRAEGTADAEALAFHHGVEAPVPAAAGGAVAPDELSFLGHGFFLGFLGSSACSRRMVWRIQSATFRPATSARSRSCSDSSLDSRTFIWLGRSTGTGTYEVPPLLPGRQLNFHDRAGRPRGGAHPGVRSTRLRGHFVTISERRYLGVETTQKEAATLGAAMGVEGLVISGWRDSPSGMDLVAAIKAGQLAIKLRDGLGEWLEQRRRRRLEEWLQCVLTHPCWDAAPEIVQDEVRRALDEDKDEVRRELIWATAKELVDCVSDAALPVIASLTAETLHGRRRMDTFYRGAVRLLADLSSEEVADLSMLLGDIQRETSAYPSKTSVRLAFLQTGELIIDLGGTSGRSHPKYDPTRLITLLKDRHLGYDITGTVGPSVSVDVTLDTVRPLLRHVRHAAKSAAPR